MDLVKKLQLSAEYINAEEIRLLKKIFLEKGYSIVREESEGMVMQSLIDGFGYDFYIGEVLVSEAEAIYGSFRGYGILMGHSRGIAEILAFMDSAFLAEDEDVLADARIICRRAIEAMQAEQERYSALVESTRVNFGLMVEG